MSNKSIASMPETDLTDLSRLMALKEKLESELQAVEKTLEMLGYPSCVVAVAARSRGRSPFRRGDKQAALELVLEELAGRQFTSREVYLHLRRIGSGLAITDGYWLTNKAKRHGLIREVVPGRGRQAAIYEVVSPPKERPSIVAQPPS